MFKALQLGNQLFHNNVIQGPLAGYSNMPFRLLTWQHSQPAFTCTEMISAKALINQPKKSYQRYTKLHPKEGPVCFQLSSNDPNELGLATKIVTDQGASLVDLNCGCPVKKIRNKGVGSRLLGTPSLLYKLITAMRQNTTLPISIKIRVNGNSDEKFNADVAKVITDAGADYLIVHGRHWMEGYETPCHYDQIAYFVDAVNIPVIGNGDIACKESVLKMLQTGCAGIMIGRAGVGQPWLIKKLLASIDSTEFKHPTPTEIKSIFLEHVTNLIELYGNEKFAIIQARKLIKYYARGIKNKTSLIEAVNKCCDLSNLITLCNHYFINS